MPRRPPSQRLLAALPDAVSAGVFATIWMAPLLLGAHAVRSAMLVMLLEFVLVHATVFLGNTALAGRAGRVTRLSALAAFGAFYLLFVAAFAWAFQAWWPFVAFFWLLLGKAAIVLGRDAPSAELRHRLNSGWAISAGAYVFGILATTLLPVPRLGMLAALLSQFDLPGSGLWVSQPHRVIAFGAVYFGFLALAKWRDWVLPASSLPGVGQQR